MLDGRPRRRLRNRILVAVQALTGDMNSGYWREAAEHRATSQDGRSVWLDAMAAGQGRSGSVQPCLGSPMGSPRQLIYAITTRIAVLKAFSAPDAIDEA